MTGFETKRDKPDLPPYVSRAGEGAYLLRVWVQPGAKNAGIVGNYQDCLKIKLKSPPVDNKANQELLDFLAGKLGLKRRDVALVGGQLKRKKIVHISMGKDSPWSL